MAPRKGQKHSGQFVKGQSGNPAGRPKAAEGWRERLRNDPDLQDLAIAIAKGQIPKPNVMANPDMLKYLLDQGFGRAPQQIEHTGKDGEDLDLNEKFESALRRIAGLKDRVEKVETDAAEDV
jgi:hypothetical protein